MVYIAYDFEGFPISMVVAKNAELANTFWQRRDIIPHSIRYVEKDFMKPEDHPTGVFPILETEEFSEDKGTRFITSYKVKRK